MTQPKPVAKADARPVGALVACVGVACAAILSPWIPQWESSSRQNLTAYHGAADRPDVWSICDGITLGVRPGQVETAEGCRMRGEAAIVAHAAPVLACTPALRGRDYQTAAAVSLAYNIGVGAYCRSSVDRAFDAGRWREGCDAMLKFNRAGGRVVAGLARRRAAERTLCLKGVSA